MAKALLTDGLLSTLPAADACPADLCIVGKLLTVPAFCLPVSAEEGSSAPVQKQGVVVQNILHRDTVKDGGREAVEREVLASKICRCFDCHQVLYEQGMFENEPVSISKIMTSQRYSLVTYAAYDVYCTNHDWNTLDKILELDAPSYYMMNILDYLVGNTDRHWENWGLLVDNETNQPIRLHDLMDFNRAFQQYDTPEGANCLTVGKRHLSQKDAAVEAVRNIGLNQVRQVEHTVFSEHPAWKATFEERLRVLRNAM